MIWIISGSVVFVLLFVLAVLLRMRANYRYLEKKRRQCFEGDDAAFGSAGHYYAWVVPPNKWFTNDWEYKEISRREYQKYRDAHPEHNQHNGGEKMSAS